MRPAKMKPRTRCLQIQYAGGWQCGSMSRLLESIVKLTGNLAMLSAPRAETKLSIREQCRRWQDRLSPHVLLPTSGVAKGYCPTSSALFL